MRTLPHRIEVSPLRFEDEDLRDFAHHLSSKHGRDVEWSTYEFPGEQRGDGAAMDMEITLERSPPSKDYKLIMNRDSRPTPGQPSDESYSSEEPSDESYSSDSS